MKCHRSSQFAVCVACAVVLTSAVGRAQSRPRPAAESDSRSTYAYRFDDDPLQAGGLGAIGALIGSMGHTMRVTLIRPRTEFVGAMIKSVENL